MARHPNALPIAAARAAGLEVMAYSESAAPQVFRQMIDLGIDYINHDHLDVTAALLAPPP
ncbi:MAG: hypothetical protein AAGF79_09995 [Pseudomonadota bacterium]